MNIAFISNRFTWHQLPLAEYLSQASEKMNFVTTQEIPEDKKGNYPDYSRFSYVESWEKGMPFLHQDCVIVGSAPDNLVSPRLRAGKLTFKYSERFYKTGFPRKKYIRNAVAAWLHHGRFQKYPLYMLCASAYTSADCAKFNNYTNRCYKWGYFPETKYYDNIEALLNKKSTARILWVARQIDWKHPELAIEVAKRLKKDQVDFQLDFIGTGDMADGLVNLVKQDDLGDSVSFLGTMPPDQVRTHMEQAGVLMFTSDFQEGWGAVTNEAMNSGCAVVASHAIGSVPFLIKDGENGLIYENENVDDLYQKVKWLLENPEEQKKLGRRAYETITTIWNAEVAAKRFVELSEAILKGNKFPNLYEDGPCSKADVIPNNWYCAEGWNPDKNNGRGSGYLHEQE